MPNLVGSAVLESNRAGAAPVTGDEYAALVTWIDDPRAALIERMQVGSTEDFRITVPTSDYDQ